jgi:hypothetical protein
MRVCAVMGAQLCHGGDLHYKTRDNPMPEADAANVMRQVSDAIRHMHSLGYCHRKSSASQGTDDHAPCPRGSACLPALAAEMFSEDGSTVTNTAPTLECSVGQARRCIAWMMVQMHCDCAMSIVRSVT